MIEATTVVSFNTTNAVEVEYIFNIALDDTLNVDSSGEVVTQFGSGDEVYLIVNKSSNVTVDAVVVTDGSISYVGAVSRSGEEQVLFSKRDSSDDAVHSMAIVPTTVDVTYTGSRSGAYTKEVSSIGVVSFDPDITKTPFLANLIYSYNCSLYKLQAPVLSLAADETHNIAVVFYITVGDL